MLLIIAVRRVLLAWSLGFARRWGMGQKNFSQAGFEMLWPKRLLLCDAASANASAVFVSQIECPLAGAFGARACAPGG
jgi:hypothetical protein